MYNSLVLVWLRIPIHLSSKLAVVVSEGPRDVKCTSLKKKKPSKWSSACFLSHHTVQDKNVNLNGDDRNKRTLVEETLPHILHSATACPRMKRRTKSPELDDTSRRSTTHSGVLSCLRIAGRDMVEMLTGVVARCLCTRYSHLHWLRTATAKPHFRLKGHTHRSVIFCSVVLENTKLAIICS